MDIRTKAVILYEEGIKTAEEIAKIYGTCDRTLRRRAKSYRKHGLDGLKPRRTGPRKAKHGIKASLERRIISLKQKYPHWGARRKSSSPTSRCIGTPSIGSSNATAF